MSEPGHGPGLYIQTRHKRPAYISEAPETEVWTPWSFLALISGPMDEEEAQETLAAIQQSNARHESKSEARLVEVRVVDEEASDVEQ